MADRLPFREAPEPVGCDRERQRAHHGRLFDVRDELRRGDEPIRMLPPHERLDRAHGAGAEVDDRLVVHDDLTALERALQILDDAPVRPSRQCGFLARVALRRVHLTVRLREQVVRRQPVLREQRPADRGVELDEAALDLVGPLEHLPHAADQCLGLLVLRRPPREDDELVAAHAGDGVRLADDRLEAPSDRPQHLVARFVSPDVVDALEPVEIDDEERERLPAASSASERLCDPVVEQRAIREAGQPITQGESLGGQQARDEERARRSGESGQRHGDHERVDRPIALAQVERRDPTRFR